MSNSKRLRRYYYARPVDDYALRVSAVRSLQTLKTLMPMQHIEELLGVSQGYLCNIHREHRTPSPMLTALLHVLAQNPRACLRQLAALWEDDLPAFTNKQVNP